MAEVYQQTLAIACMQSALVYMVRIWDFHSREPGSIPGCGTFYFFLHIFPSKKRSTIPYS
jgi:hypothetical protein